MSHAKKFSDLPGPRSVAIFGTERHERAKMLNLVHDCSPRLSLQPKVVIMITDSRYILLEVEHALLDCVGKIGIYSVSVVCNAEGSAVESVHCS